MKDTIFYANEVNKLSNQPKELQYDFYFNGIPKGKRFGKWIKKEEVDEKIEVLQAYFNINKRVAAAYAAITSDEQLKIIKDKMFKGGRK